MSAKLIQFFQQRLIKREIFDWKGEGQIEQAGRGHVMIALE